MPRWNQNLIDNLIDAVKDNNIALRYSAVLGLGQNPNYLSETHREKITTELNRVFWNKREYSFIRLAAGEAICDLWQSAHTSNEELDNREEACQESVSSSEPSEHNEFRDTLTALRQLEEASTSLRAGSLDFRICCPTVKSAQTSHQIPHLQTYNSLAFSD